jgi:hypothetical protein
MYSLSDIDKYVLRYQPKGIIVDTNPLMLLMVGYFNPARIQTCKTTSMFCEKDFDVLKDIVTRFKKIIVTPYILAELSNHSMKSWGRESRDLYAYFQKMISFMESAEESNHSLKNLLNKEVEKRGCLSFPTTKQRHTEIF